MPTLHIPIRHLLLGFRVFQELLAVVREPKDARKLPCYLHGILIADPRSHAAKLSISLEFVQVSDPLLDGLASLIFALLHDPVFALARPANFELAEEEETVCWSGKIIPEILW
jgi:hypothetical protein